MALIPHHSGVSLLFHSCIFLDHRLVPGFPEFTRPTKLQRSCVSTWSSPLLRALTQVSGVGKAGGKWRKKTTRQDLSH